MRIYAHEWKSMLIFENQWYYALIPGDQQIVCLLQCHIDNKKQLFTQKWKKAQKETTKVNLLTMQRFCNKKTGYGYH